MAWWSALISPITDTVGKVLDKVWMDKGDKEKLEFSKEELKAQMNLAMVTMAQQDKLAELEDVWREAQAQRDHQIKQFGSAQVLKDFAIGKAILMGRASIRWVIVAFAAYEAHKIIKLILVPSMIESLMNGDLAGQALWLVTTLVILIVGIPLAYVTGASIEKILKSRGMI